jgi:Glycosyltransferase family 9 (heptosyltransferase)
VPLLAERGAEITLECQPELKPLLASLAGARRVIARGQPLGEFDCHLPLLSLPYLFATSLQTIPAAVPYLKVDADRQAAWGRRVAGAGPGFKCGLVWAGNRIHRHDRLRSAPVESLAPLAKVGGVRFFSLQKGADTNQVTRTLPAIVDVAADLNDYADTAAVLSCLDLLISVDTSAAHLAGALGRPVWTLLSQVPDWRWMLERDCSPWYPTMRLLRQPRPGDWASVIRRAAGDLADYVVRQPSLKRCV